MVNNAITPIEMMAETVEEVRSTMAGQHMDKEWNAWIVNLQLSRLRRVTSALVYRVRLAA